MDYRALITCALSVLIFSADSKTIPGFGAPGDPCEMGGGIMGRCEELTACLQERGVIQRSGQVGLCQSGVSGDIHVCCRKPHVIAEELCEAWNHYWRDGNGQCQVDHPLIIGGTSANIGEFPHMALLGRKYRSEPIDYMCGGTLISPHFVLTAAHCLYNYVDGITYWVKLGEHDLEHDARGESISLLDGPLPSSLFEVNDLRSKQTTGTASVEQIIEVVKEYIHPSHNLLLNYHDIALLKLRTPAKFTKRVLPACLPFQYPEEDYVGQKLTVTGWGYTSRIRELSRTLQKVEVPVVDRLSCSVTKANSQKTPWGITEDMLCAGEHGRDSCKGDSGGPLTTQVARNGSNCEHTVVGVVSYGIGSLYVPCGSLGVYGRVSSYLDWITGYIAPNVTGVSLNSSTR